MKETCDMFRGIVKKYLYYFWQSTRISSFFMDYKTVKFTLHYKFIIHYKFINL